MCLFRVYPDSVTECRFCAGMFAGHLVSPSPTFYLKPTWDNRLPDYLQKISKQLPPPLPHHFPPPPMGVYYYLLLLITQVMGVDLCECDYVPHQLCYRTFYNGREWGGCLSRQFCECWWMQQLHVQTDCCKTETVSEGHVMTYQLYIF